jgi:ribose transport system permease protein
MQATLKKILVRGGPFIGLILVVAFFSIAVPLRTHTDFLTYYNFKIIFTQTVLVALGALGMTLIIVGGGIDLSVGSTIAFSGVICARLLQQDWPTGAVVAAAVAGGALIGLANGALIAGLRMVPFIVTLGSLGIVRGTTKWLANNQAVYYPTAQQKAANPDTDSPIVHWMSTADPSSRALPVGVWTVLLLAVLTTLLLRKTVFGRHIFAIGSNEQTARLCGLPTVRLKILIYALAGGLFGLAGLFQFARLHGQGDPTAAVGLELDIIAAVIVGGASLSGGMGTVLGSMIGALLMAVLRTGTQQMGWENYFQEIIIGAVIIVAVYLDRLRHRRAEE